MLRYYERIGLTPTAGRTGSGYRIYTEADVQTLRFVHRARELGFVLVAIRRLLTLWQDKARSSRDVKLIALDTIEDLQRKRAELDAMVRSLEHLADNCRGDERPDCPIIDGISSRTHDAIIMPSLAGPS